ncbi:exonuclease sbcCD subunit D [Chryseobacterium lactis]|uniref:Nuclease SbcCD subunit D n=1 Tax=Chryseobacterium lactis TaxID=1241981 RepID=A0A3G6RVJ2_CHRLC|nr:exonuclease subunit SbcD [Chryseobacterium lactis]AZA82059.1 exonuclease subunit SbcD [Chryseobacterium lactis]AZB07057.1 exonuclease subunit SbcD [Chryseobacterium lactis]PNW14265.1 exonuclease sbcCD subunit D [Chryseobacterium lactis]
MKILHTADWHLGKRLDRFSRLEEQVLVMEEIISIADDEKVDLVIVAGDLFDSFNPSVEAVELFYKTLKRLSQNGKRPVIAISGNHDSPNLIDAPDPLARECGIILIGHPKAEILPFENEYFKILKSKAGFIELKIENTDFPVRILHTPYANEIRLKEYFGENKEEEINKVLAQTWKNLADEFCDDSGVNLLTAHLYMNKRGAEILEEPEGEKPIKIGNADIIYSDIIPDQIQYTALGHLHAFQNIGTAEKPVIYSSSPLCYSFSEAGQKKYISIIEANPGKAALYEKKQLKNGRTLVRKTFTSVEDTIQWLKENPNTFIELTLESETFLTVDERKLIYQSHNGIVHLIPKVKNRELMEGANHEINLSQDIDILFRDYFKSKNGGQEANEELMNLFNEILNA